MRRTLTTGVRTAGLAALTCVAVAVLFATCPPLPQPLKYHDFADQRCLCCGVPNTADVLSNAPFLLVSAIGLDHILGGTALGALGLGHVLGAPVFADRAVELPLWITFFLGVGLVALGSGYYHWRPDNARLVWDRLPMTIGFMALLAVVLTDTVIEATAEATNATLGVLITLGLASVVWWARYDDLRPYVLVQFYSLFLVPLLLALFPSRYDGANAEIVTALAFCKRSSSLGPFFETLNEATTLCTDAGAKITEGLDKPIFKLTRGCVSGHTLKHLLSGVATFWGTVILLRRRERVV